MNKRELERQKRKDTLINTIIDLILKKGKEPTITEIISNSSISRRTLFNYYNRREKLIEDVRQEVFRRIETMFLQNFLPRSDSFETLATDIVNNRAKVFEFFSSFQIVLLQRKIKGGNIQKYILDTIKKDREHLRRKFSPFLKDLKDEEKTIVMMQNVLSWQNWGFLRKDAGHSVEEVIGLLIDEVIAIYKHGKVNVGR